MKRNLLLSSLFVGAAICGLCGAELPRQDIALTNGHLVAVVDATLGGRVLVFGRPGGRNWLWRNEAARNLTDAKTWRNVGGEKTWVGTIADWRTQFGCKVGWPPPKWFDGAAFSVERRGPASVSLLSPVSSGDFWKVQLRRDVFLEGESLVIRSTLATKAPTRETPDRMWNWSVAQVPEAKRLAVHLVGRKRCEWTRKGGPAKRLERDGWVFYDFADFGESGLMNFDADAVAAEYDDGWLVLRHQADPKTVEPFKKPCCAVFHSGLSKDMNGDSSKQYVELEFLCYGPNTTMDVRLSLGLDAGGPAGRREGE